MIDTDVLLAGRDAVFADVLLCVAQSPHTLWYGVTGHGTVLLLTCCVLFDVLQDMPFSLTFGMAGHEAVFADVLYSL